MSLEFIPTRTTFATWDINGLLDKSKTVLQAGQDLEMAVHTLRYECSSLPEMRGWEGAAHTAAEDMFVRTAKHAGEFAEIAYSGGRSSYQGVSNIADRAYDSLSSVKGRLDTLIETIENGPLEVNDLWVVVLKPEPMDDARFKVLKQAQAGFQDQLNPLVTELGKADDEVRSKLAFLVSRVNKDYEMDPTRVTYGPEYLPRTGVPDPSTEQGRTDQQQIQQMAASTTVRHTETSEPDINGSTTTTMTMQDGSKQTVLTNKDWGITVASSYDPSGELKSTTSTTESPVTGRTTTTTEVPGQMKVTVWKDKDGKTGGTVTDLTTGKTYPIPDESALFNSKEEGSDFFTHPYLTSVGGGLSALETYSGNALDGGRGIPMLSDSATQKVHVGAKVLGPGLSLAVTGWDVIHAETMHEKCVAGTSGLAGTAGGMVGGTLGASVTGGSPWGAFFGGAFGAWTFGAAGTALGEGIVCR
ncbi:hypothetical protein [Nocardia rhizosphaerae]|uniref:WXG100 family type VII secretion target n=1 Tax=Nocardia rhizosphaerae TaxID=1691571 RepID=A0ABV8L785_9NOCA